MLHIYIYLMYIYLMYIYLMYICIYVYIGRFMLVKSGQCPAAAFLSVSRNSARTPGTDGSPWVADLIIVCATPLEKQKTSGFNGKTMGHPWENHRKMEVYPLVNVYITMERSTIFNG